MRSERLFEEVHFQPRLVNTLRGVCGGNFECRLLFESSETRNAKKLGFCLVESSQNVYETWRLFYWKMDLAEKKFQMPQYARCHKLSGERVFLVNEEEEILRAKIVPTFTVCDLLLSILLSDFGNSCEEKHKTRCMLSSLSKHEMVLAVYASSASSSWKNWGEHRSRFIRV